MSHYFLNLSTVLYFSPPRRSSLAFDFDLLAALPKDYLCDFTKFSGKVAHEPRKKPLDFCGNPDPAVMVRMGLGWVSPYSAWENVLPGIYLTVTAVALVKICTVLSTMLVNEWNHQYSEIDKILCSQSQVACTLLSPQIHTSLSCTTFRS